MGFIDGNFDILGVQYGLSNGFKINGEQFHPEVFLYQVNEPEYGCEGRQEGKPAYAELYGYTMTGPVKWLLNEKTLLESELFDNMWIGMLEKKDGMRELVSYRDGNEDVKPLDREKWAEKLPAK